MTFTDQTSGDDTDIEYNWDNKLRSASKGTETIDLKYDPMGNRVWKSGAAGERKYIVDISGQLPTILMEIESGSIVRTYVYANSQILMMHPGPADATPPDNIRYFYLHDRLGSVRQVLKNTDADVNNHYTYDPFGQIFDTDVTIDSPFMFTGQYYDIEIAQYYLRARMYDPQLMRFTGRDPLFGKAYRPMTLHRYLYCNNDSINRVDPDGQCWLAIRLLIGAVSGVVSAGLESDWDGTSMAWGLASGMVSAILPAKFASVILSAGMSGLKTAYAEYQEHGDMALASAAGFSGFIGGALGGSASYLLGIKLEPYMGLGTSKNVMESMGLVSFVWGEAAGNVAGWYLGAPIDSIDGLQEHMEEKRRRLDEIGFGE